MRVWCLLVALVLALQGVGCAQVKKAGAKESLADRVALRIATAKLITDAFKQANRDLMTFGRFPEPLDDPMDLKAARILVQAYADAPSGTLDSAARLLDVANIESAQIAALVAKDAKYQGYLDQLLQFAAADVESRNKSVSDTSEQV